MKMIWDSKPATILAAAANSVVEKKAASPQRYGDWKATGEIHRNDIDRKGGFYDMETKTLGFRPTCTCYPPGQEETRPAVILDPFGGSGTVGEAATLLGRDYILIEVNPEYGKLIEKRTQAITSPLLPELV